ncbi:hypothetical protein F5X96DRAFT_670456 [Biscogniauxia mediterranea]|nr:hypothetical protein F5X96DRAFT_670456 [Biscogniauxia mediterranea]
METDTDITRPESPGAVACGVFTYHKMGGFKAYGHSRHLVERTVVDGKSRSWVMAQLTLHGVVFDPRDDDSRLKRKLLSLVQEDDKPTKLPFDIQIFSAELRDRYLSDLRDHRFALLHWRNLKFERLETPTEEALFDVEKFIEKYFLSIYNTPDPSKTKEAIVLHIAPMGELKDLQHTLKQGIRAAFASIDRPGFPLDVPTSEVNLDVGLFLEKYFVDGEGRAMQSKTLDPIEFAPFLDPERRDELAAAIRRVPGLSMERVASKTRGLYTVVGWKKDVDAHKEARTDKQLHDDTSYLPHIVLDINNPAFKHPEPDEHGNGGLRSLWCRGLSQILPF